ncbi:tetratricopeptide repeat protein [Leadbettera azotonutricia]|uniref:Tetratricopeptide repeat domain protein n=1 Tax=Leadbettera azotonutricia (strain ATCC BAA-888 / DSM 13862 / ZAS-9) TaxID=545695 RepID=F5Y8F3_LEAAZ|nr:tetratricopeptide repeat protein [Leadbettera azotonutricia]AEF81889.1 tetratricopeptide repeat domain protein [Leadbettera azotonutricia ZAS-9]
MKKPIIPINTNTIYSVSILTVLLLTFFSCSSAPKKPLEVLTDRNMAASQLDLANRTANQGRYNDALLILEDAWVTAVSVDDPGLLIKCSLSRGNILFSMGRHDEAFSNWDYAQKEGENAGIVNLVSQARIARARGQLVLLMAGSSGIADPAAVEAIKVEVRAALSAMKSDPMGEASGNLVLGMAEKELARYPEAEYIVRRALEIHEKNRYLEEAAYDWYLIASIRSVSGSYNRAAEALRTAISFDRRAENGFGLASSWQALGDVYLKMGNASDAEAAYKRAAGIFEALGLPVLAEKIRAKPGL